MQQYALLRHAHRLHALAARGGAVAVLPRQGPCGRPAAPPFGGHHRGPNGGAGPTATGAHFALAAAAGVVGCAASVCRTSRCEEGLPAQDGRYAQAGDWRQDTSRSQSLGPFLRGLGVPSFAVILVDALRVDLHISCTDGLLRVTDKTWFGTNTTEAVLGADEVERATRTGRKRFMLSGSEDAHRLVVQCRLFQRGDGWISQQSWAVRPEDGCLEERMMLRRPGEEDVVITRIFTRLGNSVGAPQERRSSAGTDPSDVRQRDSAVTPAAAAGCALALVVLGLGLHSARRTQPRED
mmetsp:Transcript_176141/g.564736  ORF Transcript_176141/g.564736 Transcript_176141/m.564736 type:complete len:295 (-) Transcript_176141:55-939(-)